MITPRDTTTDIETLVNELRFDFMEAPELVLEFACKQAIMQFCRDTDYWREESIVFVPSLGTGNPILEAHFDIHIKVLNIKRVFMVSDKDRVALVPYEEGDSAPSFERIDERRFRVSPFSTLAGSRLAVICSLCPMQSSEHPFTFPTDFILSQRDTIMNLARYTLYRQNNKSWTNPSLAQESFYHYQQGLGRAISYIANDYSATPNRITNKRRNYF